MVKPNPRNCSTCEHAVHAVTVTCTAPVPLWVGLDLSRVVDNPEPRCDAHKTAKGSFARICLNCGHPIRVHHKYTNLNPDQWIHKCCEFPESYSKYHRAYVEKR
jgi:hypothetical protein